MNTFVLAGGHATRLRPLTKDRPKPLLPLGRTTILDHLLDRLGPSAGRTVVSTNAKFGGAFEAWKAATRRDLTIEVEAQRSEEEKPGALAAIHAHVKGFKRPDDLLVLGGDNVIGFDLRPFVAEAAKRPGPTVACVDVGSKERARLYGVVEPGAGDLVRAFHEKPQDPPSTLAATAIYYYPAQTLRYFDEYAKANAGKKAMDAPGRILEWVAHRHAVHFHAFDGPWFDVGSLDGYIEAQAAIAGRFVDGEAKGSQLGERVFVYEGAVVEDSTLDSVVLLPGARVRKSRLTRVAVDEHASLDGVELVDSIVGAHTRLAGPGR